MSGILQAEIEKNLVIGLIGDSTVATTYGWGPAFAKQVNKNVTVLNYAKNGATLDSLSRRLDDLLAKKPDYVLVQFGHNDMKVYDAKAYAKKLKNYVLRIKKAGSKAIILSSVTRRNFDEDGKILPRTFNGNESRILPNFALSAKALAKEQKVPFLDLNTISIAHHNQIGEKESQTYNFEPTDTTHFSPKGAQAIASIIIKELESVAPDLFFYLHNGNNPIKVFLLAGQSNMVGQVYGGGLNAPYNQAYSKVKTWDYRRNKWVALAPAYRIGPEIGFGHAITKVLPDDDIRLVKYAANGTNLYKKWAPSTGRQYINFMKASYGALADLENKKIPYEITGMLWLQGESDGKEQKGAEYKKNLSNFIKDIRLRFNSPNMPFIIARVRNFYGKGKEAQLVRKAQADLAQEMASVACFDTDDLNPLINGGHYNLENTITIGQRFAQNFDLISKEINMSHEQDKNAFDTAINQNWKEVFNDPCTENWQEKWFLDGKIAAVTNRANGMQLAAGPQFLNDDHHMVLWTKEEFTGDLKIEFDYTRTDFATRCVNIIYIQATGSGKAPYSKDISEWNNLRTTPAMKMYFNHMNTYHISFAAFNNTDDLNEDYIRARRYIPNSEGLENTDLEPDYFNTGLFKPGEKHHFTIIKKDQQLFMKISNNHQTAYFHWNNTEAPGIESGRIGLRHMFTRSAIYKDFKISVPQ
ncbi:DUF1961 family protein [Lentisphaera marina]|uniref:DUF1961 family protein n=1 Tax=Lentisphaera marina TaxID=1111041 RepID=UPI00236597AA|nr:DUF1961 family protein [Lentisphaera marina]MDD7985321.1 DUF1961 family protein [Lentisphaera marina]